MLNALPETSLTPAHKVIAKHLISSTATINFHAMHEFIECWWIRKVLHSNTSLLSVSFDGHGINESREDFIIVILSIKHIECVLNAGGVLCILLNI